MFSEAVRHHQAGRWAEAESLYRKILVAEAHHAGALNLFGVIAHQRGRSLIAVSLIGRAIAITANVAAYHSNFGLALQALRRFDDALASYDSALCLKPDFADAYYNRGCALLDRGRSEAAITTCDATLRLKPDFVEAHTNRGVALKDLGRLDEAIASYDVAICLKPDYAKAHTNRGSALQSLGRIGEAIRSHEEAVRSNPGYAEAHYNRGCALPDSGAAAACYATALCLEPDFADAFLNRGNALRDWGRLTPALACYDAALRIRPQDAGAYMNRGAALNDAGRLDDAVASYDAALKLRQDFAEAFSNRQFTLYYGSETTDETIAASARHYAAQFEGRHAPPDFANDPAADRRLRVGYVSADFHRHSVSYFLTPVLARHDHGRFEIYCYSNGTKSDEVTERLRGMADHWRSIVELSDQSAADLIRGDQIDILVDLSGHTRGNRLTLFAGRAAPVQVTWLGFPGTTGLLSIDYRLVDATTDPIGIDEDFATETLYRLPRCFLCYEPPAGAPSPRKLTDKLTFGSFNNLAKLSNATLDVWAKLLHRLPESRLLLKSLPLDDSNVARALIQRFAARGVDAQRIVLKGMVTTTGGHLAVYDEIDIGLDPFPYNGTTTTCEALWMGVPVVTLRGTRHSARVGASLLNAVGLGELVGETIDDYLQIAVSLAENTDRRQNLRTSLREKMAQSALCDARAFTAGLEAAFNELWRRRYSPTVIFSSRNC